ncbi:arylamine N-acetyltransferase family protein [Micromonospora sp. DT31]|uniref:arylamine N-acetyltransferase family protein n=1 Tax=Micromonospora sp. DT31 TaxID=3393434 RepID=UPI003CF3232C
MFNVEKYVAKLGYTGPLVPDLDTLRILHKLHLMNVPFDNYLNEARGLGIWDGVDIDVDEIFAAVIVGGRGGVCYELNGLFRELLRRIGYDVMILSAGVRAPDGTYGPELEHVFTGVNLDGERWLVDVGFSGPSYIEPVRSADEAQEQYGSRFKVVAEDGFLVLERQVREGDWRAVYRFRERPRDVAEWSADNPELNAYARQLAAHVLHIRARATDRGQMTLVGRRFLRVSDGHEQVRVLVRPNELQEVLDDILLRA